MSTLFQVSNFSYSPEKVHQELLLLTGKCIGNSKGLVSLNYHKAEKHDVLENLATKETTWEKFA